MIDEPADGVPNELRINGMPAQLISSWREGDESGAVFRRLVAFLLDREALAPEAPLGDDPAERLDRARKDAHSIIAIVEGREPDG